MVALKTLPPIDGLSRLSDATLSNLRAAFADDGFSWSLVEQAESFVPGVLREPRLPLLRWWLSRRKEPGAILARLFVYHDTLTADELDAVLGNELVASLLEAGILARVDQNRVGAPFTFTPTGAGLWMLSDSHTLRDSVMGPAGGTELLGRLVPRPFHGTALDVGCGAGTLALTAAQAGATRAVGVDINARAVDVARFNARLNALSLEARVGDVVAPVAGDRFDLVLAQPPFVVQPPEQPGVTYLHGGPRGDELPHRFLGEMSRVLAPGGRAIMLMQTAERDDGALAARLRDVVPAEPAVDILVIALPAPPLAAQASVFASLADPTLGEGYERAALGFLDHFEREGMHEFIAATVVLSRPAAAAGRPTYAADRPTYTFAVKLGHGQYDAPSLDAYLGGLDLIMRPAAFLEGQRLRMSPWVHMMPDPSGRDASGLPRALVRIAPPGVGTDHTLGASELEVLANIDASDTVGAALETTARTRGLAVAALRQDFLTFVRAALLRGALVRSAEVGA